MMLGAWPKRQPMLHHVADRVARFAVLSADERTLVETVDGEVATHLKGADLTLHAAQAPRLILSGWAGLVRTHPARRQIFSFLLPGDFIGSFWRASEFTFAQIIALTRLQTLDCRGLASAEPAGDLARANILKGLRGAEDYGQHLLFDHIVRLGARDAYGGMAHLLLEFHARLGAVGLADGGDFPLPIGQRILAQAMGFSLAHTNYTLQRMAADGLLESRGEHMRLLRLDRLSAIAEPQGGGGQAQRRLAMDRLHDQPEVYANDGGR